VERLDRQPVRANGLGEALEARVRRLAPPRDAPQRLPIRIEVRQAFRRRQVAFVGEVVGRAREPVDRRDCRPQVTREQDRGNRKIS